MLALKMMYYIYIYLQGKVFMVYYFFKTSSFLNSFIYFIYLFLTVLGLHCCMGLSLVAETGGCSLLQCTGFSWWLLLLQNMGSGVHGLP